MALTQISTEGIKNGTITGSDLATNVDLVDNQKLRFGTGNDLEIYFNGTNSVIAHVPNSGDLILQAPTGETSIRCNASSSVDLYYDNNKKFETTSTGATLTGVLATDSVDISSSGNLSLPDNRKIYIGTGNDTRVYHNGADLYIDNDTGGTWIGLDSGATFGVGTGPAASPQALKAVIGAQVELMHNGTKKFDTTSYGTRTTGNHTITGQLTLETDGQKAVFGAGDDLQIYHNGTNDFIQSNGGYLKIQTDSLKIHDRSDDHPMIEAENDGAVKLYHDNSKKFETQSAGAQLFGNLTVGTDGGAIFLANPDGFSPKLQENAGSLEFYTNNNLRMSLGNGGNLLFQDNRKAEFGASSDLKIYHDGTKSYIDNNTGDLEVHFPTRIELQGNNGSEVSARFITDGAVELFYDNSKKLDTASYGVIVRGQCYSTQTGSSYPAFQAGDDGRIGLGDSNDLQIYHDGTSNYISSQTGNLYIEAKSGETAIQIVPDGAVDLRYNGSKKVETTANGATIDGGSNISMDSSGNGQLKVNGSGYSGAIALDGTAMNIYHNSSSRGIVFGINETEVARFSNQGRFYVNRTGELKGGDTISVETTHSGHGGGAYIMSWKGDSDVLSIRNHGSGDYELVNNGGGNELSLYDGSGGAKLEYYDNGNYIGMVSDYAASNRAYSRTTSGSANMNVNSSGYMRRSTSSQRYKNNIREYAGKGIEILKNIIPKTWEDHEEGTTHHGFIAEEFHSAGLTTAVLYEPYIGGEEIGIGEEKGDFYGNGTPPVTKTGEALDDEVLVVDGVDQTTILAELVIAVKQLNSRLEALEE